MNWFREPGRAVVREPAIRLVLLCHCAGEVPALTAD